MNIVAHNLSAMNAQRQFGINAKSKAKSTEKLSSGYKINRAADDAAGLAISEKMRRMIRGLNQGAENTQDGISFVQIGDGAMDEIHDMLHRMTELSIKAANGTLTEDDRAYIDQEVQALKTEINRVSETTVFNEIPIFDNHSVVFGLEGTPTDLEIYDATYDATGNLATYGGFLFHGERISWDMIDSGMVTTDANGKQVFVGGDYSYTSNETGYSFAFYCKDGAVPPVITREISIEADGSGIILGKERFDWSKVYDLEGNPCSENNLHAGPWAVDYYGSKFVFTVPEPVVSLEEMAKDVDSCKNASVSYNWEVYYKEGSYESAVDVNEGAISVKDNIVTQKTVDTMKNLSQTGLEMTVRADDTGVWLQQSDGAELAGSRKTWEEFGIKSWEEGMEVPGWSNGTEVLSYTYENSETGLSYNFELSDITSVDSVIDGLDGMKITGTPGDVRYEATAEVQTVGNVKGVTCSDSGIALTFKEEIDIDREFDTQNWTIDSLDVNYTESSDGGKVEATFAGGMTFVGSTNAVDDEVRAALVGYMDWVKGEMLTGATSISADAYSPSTGNVELTVSNPNQSNEFIRLTYDYDYGDVFTNLTDNVKLESVNTGHDASTNLYVKRDDGSYVSSQVYLQELIDAEGDAITEDKKNQLKEDVKNMEKFQFQYTLEDGKNTSAPSTSAVADSVLPQIFKELADSTTVKLTSQDYSRVRLQGNENPNVAVRPVYNAVMKETPVKPDIYIVHSAQSGDKTGIPRFAMNTTVLGVAFANCKTVEGASQLLNSTKKALEYVSTKRSQYGAIQNRLEHTYNNNRNISENMSAAESQIRDTDMAKEMVKYSNINILEQVGHAMMAQANQANQGVLSLLS